jgi:hypothetical protein
MNHDQPHPIKDESHPSMYSELHTNTLSLCTSIYWMRISVLLSLYVYMTLAIAYSSSFNNLLVHDQDLLLSRITGYRSNSQKQALIMDEKIPKSEFIRSCDICQIVF